MSRIAMPVQTGEVIDYKNSGTEQINAGDVVPMVKVCGIAEINIAPGETGSVAITKIWEVPSVSGTAFVVGDVIFWDTTAKKATKTATSNTPLGLCVAPKTAGEVRTRVKIGLCVA